MSDVIKKESCVEQLKDEILLLTDKYQESNVPEEKEGFISRIFKFRKRKQNAIENNSEHIYLDNFVGMLTTCLSHYSHNMTQCLFKIRHKISAYVDFNFNNYTLNILDPESKEIHLSVKLIEGIELVSGKEEMFEKYKILFYNLKYVIDGFLHFKKSIEKSSINISEISSIKTSVTLEENVVNSTVKIGNIGLLEIQSSPKDINLEISAYSSDYEVTKYLMENKLDLLKKIYIPNSQISNLLIMYNEIKRKI